MTTGEIEVGERSIAWEAWSMWYGFWAWVLAFIMAPVWAFSRALQQKGIDDWFRGSEQAVEEAVRHLRWVRQRVEDAESERRWMDISSPDAVVAERTTFAAFLNNVATIERGEVDQEGRHPHNGTGRPALSPAGGA